MKIYVKPALKVAKKNCFVFKTLKAHVKSEVTCKGCSSCHGCRG